MKYFLLAAAIAAADRLTKLKAEENPGLGGEIPLSNRLSIKTVRNTGAAMGLLAGRPRLLAALTAISGIDVLKHYFILHKEGGLDPTYKLSLACVAGGAAGNLGDRARQGYVTDFICLRTRKTEHVFNIADIAIVVGMGIFLFKKLRATG